MQRGNNVFIDSRTKKSIGLDEIMNSLPTLTDYGAIAKMNMTPYLKEDIGELRIALEDLSNIVKFAEFSKRRMNEIKGALHIIKDIRGSIKRLKRREILNEVEFFELKSQFIEIERLRNLLMASKEIYLDRFKLNSSKLEIELLDPEKAGTKTFYMYDAFSVDLSEIRKKKREIEKNISLMKEKLREEVFDLTGLMPSKSGEIRINTRKKSEIAKLKSCVKIALSSESFSVLVFKVKNSKDLKVLINELDDLEIQEEKEEFKIRKMLVEKLSRNVEKFEENIVAVGELDLFIAKAIYAMEINAVKPKVCDSISIIIEKGRHISTENALKSKGSQFTPVDISLRKGVTLITGANMGGKTVNLKMVSLIVALAQYAMFVPAESARIGLVNFVYLSVGDEQSEKQGLSTFGAEIFNLKEVISKSNETGLILIDEIARGTNPTEGQAIAKAIINYLKNKNSVTIITSHFDGLCTIEGVKHLQVKGLSGADISKMKSDVRKNEQYEVIFEKHMDYRLEKVKNVVFVPRDALLVAEIMGLNKEIIDSANEMKKN
ncbi:MAG: DNA mismatch repair protein MutS [Clostridiales bacterium]|nr:DNA mismatch repair protein MutS [Clostridiales bacterium]